MNAKPEVKNVYRTLTPTSAVAFLEQIAINPNSLGQTVPYSRPSHFWWGGGYINSKNI